MDIKIVWTDSAIADLENIFDYYLFKANIIVANKLIKEIVLKSKILLHSPQIGQKEPLLIDRKKEYRYLVSGNYKIIYWFETNVIKIASVFDCRQNPTKMTKINS